MTNILTRYFESVDHALSVRYELVNRQRFPQSILTIFDSVDGLTERLSAAGADPKTAAAYADKLAGGGAVMMIRAGFKPLGVAKIARKTLAASGVAEMPGLVEEVIIKDKVQPGLSILPDHPRMVTRAYDPTSSTVHMANWPIPLISRRKPFTGSIIKPHAKMAEIEPLLPLPIPFADRKPFDQFAFPRHARMANFPLPLLSDRKPYTGSAIAPHARMANFPLPLISRRKPFRGSIIARHARMANWPFPHLINGKRHMNSLVPGAPRMANFPIGLLSGRKPFTGSIFGRHSRMANFPLPLLSGRKPFTGSAIPRHGRMADMILPLVIRRAEPEAPEARKGFSLSKLLGLRTVINR